MTTHDLVKKVIGNIAPVGESNEDEKRYQNLKEMCQLVENLLYDIDDLIYRNNTAHEASIKKSVEYARNFMKLTVKQLVAD